MNSVRREYHHCLLWYTKSFYTFKDMKNGNRKSKTRRCAARVNRILKETDTERGEAIKSTNHVKTVLVIGPLLVHCILQFERAKP